MPTPVNTARQCLTDDAARALDDAVAVARRRSHSQTTSLHAVSALLALPSSSLREACGRVRSSGYSPALQLRALELCVGVALDRLPSAKNLDDDPPISNSLMAAIKRSQANQRRNPESFHLHQMCHIQSQSNLAAAEVMKVELKHYILSILDDPIVSRVLGDAGYRSCDVKLGIVSPPVSAGLRFSGGLMRCPPPIFMVDSDWRGFQGDEDGICRRIGEVLVRKSGRNPLLVGVCAIEALNSFKACVRNRKPGVLPGEIDGVEVLCIADMIAECVVGGGNEEKMRLRLNDLEVTVEGCAGRGVVVSLGNVKVLVDETASSDEVVSCLILELGNLLRKYPEKLWLVGAVPDDKMHKKFAGRFPGVEVNWDLHLLPITSNLFGEGFGPKSSLMRSFVPFGGFFSNPSDYSPLSNVAHLSNRCQSCNEKYEQEVSTILKVGSNVQTADQCSSSLPTGLQTNLYQSKEADAGQAKLEGTTFRARILGLQQKWNGICQNLHPSHQSPKSDVSCSKVPSAVSGSLHIAEGRKQSSSRDPSISQSSSPNSSPSMATSSKNGSPRGIARVSKARMSRSPPELPARGGVLEVSKERIASPPELPAIRGIPEVTKVSMTHASAERPAIIPAIQQISVATPKLVSLSQQNFSFTPDHVPSSHLLSVTTNLGLGTIYSPTRKPAMQDCGERLEGLSTLVSEQSVKLPCHSSLHGTPLDLRDFKALWRSLNNSVSWQDEAIHKISQCISHCKSAIERRRSANIWLGFVGNDKVGKRKIAAALAEAMSGRKHDLIHVDLCLQDGLERSESMFFQTGVKELNVLNRGKTMVDCIASQLSHRPNSVVLLENLDKADMLIRTSLLQAIRTAKFPDSHGREISLNNMIFILAASSTETTAEDASCVTKQVRFCEERILEAKCWKLRFAVGDLAVEAIQSSYKNVLITQPEASLLGKRRFCDLNNYPEGARKTPRSFLDLNLPVDELEHDFECESSESESMSEGSETWLEQFFTEVDEKVALKPYDFDALADGVLKAVSTAFENTCPGIRLEISHHAMNQILAASWLSDKTTAVEDWIKSVLSRSFVEAHQRYNHLSSQSVVKLVTCEGMQMENEAPDILLPCSIIVS